jgi:hypothetical protein
MNLKFRWTFLLMVILSSWVWAQSPTLPAGAEQTIRTSRHSLVFEKNMGQYDELYQYVARDRQATYYFMADEMRSVVQDAGGNQSFTFGLKFIGVNTATKPIGLMQRGDMGQQHTLGDGGIIRDIPLYTQLRYPGMWPKIHTIFTESDEGMKYDFVVSPGGNPADIVLEMSGVTNLRVTAKGELSYLTPFGELTKGSPYTYQYINGQTVEVPCRYIVEGNRVSFALGDYDRTVPLVIDPVALKWATLLGGTEEFVVTRMVYGPEDGHLYMVGYENGLVYPSNYGISGPSTDNRQAFVMCMNGDGSTIRWKTSIRSKTGYSKSHGLTLDADGNIYVHVNTITNNSTAHPFGGIQAAIPGPLVSFVPRGGAILLDALFKLSPNGETLQYFTYLHDVSKPIIAGRAYATTAHFPMLIDHNGHLVMAVGYTQGYFDEGELPENVFSPNAGNAFGIVQPRTMEYSIVLTINTAVPGPTSVVHAGLTEHKLSAVGKDAGGNIYFAGTMGFLRGQYLDRITVDYFTAPYITHLTLDTVPLYDYLRSRSGNRVNTSAHHTLFKLSPDQQDLLFGGYVGFQVNDFYYTTADMTMDVSPEGDVYVGALTHIYNGFELPLMRHWAEREIVIGEMIDIYGCGGYCWGLSFVEKLPADNYQHPEWIMTLPPNAGDNISFIKYDTLHERIHLVSTQMVNYQPDGFKALTTVGALQTNEHPLTFIHYMQVNPAGEVPYATVLSPDLGSTGNYIGGVSSIDVHPQTGEVGIARVSMANSLGQGTMNFRDYVTPSYHDFSRGEQVLVYGASNVQPANSKNKSSIMIFHEVAPAENIIADFLPSEREFCTGSLIGMGVDALPIEGNLVKFTSGDGSSPEHNLPMLSEGGQLLLHPNPSGIIPIYQWQQSFRAVGATDFGPWENIDKGVQALLEPQLITVPGTVRYRRLRTYGQYFSESNVIEAEVVGAELPISITGPSGPVYFCPGESKDLGIQLNHGGGGSISWQWYEGYVPIRAGIITPSSGMGIMPQNFEAAIAAGNTQSGFYRLLVTDELTGCKKEYFVSIYVLSDQVYNTASVNLCPGDDAAVTIGPLVVNPNWDYRYTQLSDMSQLSGNRPVVSAPGTYRLEVSVVGENAFCANGATEVTINQPIGPFDASLLELAPVGYCETDMPSPIGLPNAPVEGYRYRWFPTAGLSATDIANPVFNPATAAWETGIRTIDYLFEAVRQMDGCIFSTTVTVSDTTQAIATCAEEIPFIVANCSPSSILLRALPGYKGRNFRWRAVATNYPGGMAALEASPDYGVGATGQLEANVPFCFLYYPSEFVFYVDMEFTASYGTIGETNCYDIDTMRIRFGGCGDDVFCLGIIPADVAPGTPVCSSENTILSVRADQGNTAVTWSVVEVDGVPVPEGTEMRGIFTVTDDNTKGLPIGEAGNHPPRIIVHLEDPEWGLSGVQQIRIRYSALSESYDKVFICEDEITVNAAIELDPFELPVQISACNVLPPGEYSGTGRALPYYMTMSDYTVQPRAGYEYRWRVVSGTANSILSPNTLEPAFSPAMSTVYELTLTDPISGCVSRDSMLLNVRNIVADAGPDFIDYSPGVIIQLGLPGEIDYQYSWSPDDGLFFPDPLSPNADVAQPFMAFPNAPDGVTLTLTVTDEASGCAATDFVILSSSSDPPATPANASFTVCQGSSLSLGPLSYTRQDVRFVWSAGAGADLSWLSNPSVRNPILTLPGNFLGTLTYTLTVVSDLSGASGAATYTVTVPNPSIALDANTPVNCTYAAPYPLLGGNNISLASGFSGEWLQKAGLFTDANGTTAYTAGASVDVFVGPVSQPTVYTLRVKHNLSGCFYVYNINVLPPDGALQVNAGPDLTYCSGSSPLDLGLTADGATSIIWTATGYSENPESVILNMPDAATQARMLAYLSNPAVVQPKFSQINPAPGKYRYRITVTDSGGNTLSDEVVVRVPHFASSLLPGSATICSGVPTALLTTNVPSTYAYQWQVVSPAASAGTITAANTATALFSPTLPTVYQLTYFDPSSNCTNTQRVSVSIASALQLPAVADIISCEPITGLDVTAMVSGYSSLPDKKWYRNAWPGPQVAEPIAVNVTGDVAYILQAANTLGCRDTMLIRIRAEQPVTPFTISNYTLPFLSSTVDLTLFTPTETTLSGAEYIWYSTADAEEDSRLYSLELGPGTYYLAERSGGGCLSATTALTVYQRPYLNILSAEKVCVGTAASAITATAAEGYSSFNYRWQKSTINPSSGAIWQTIADANSLSLYPGVLNESTWFRLLVSTDGTSFTALPGSNVLEVAVDAGISLPENTVSSASIQPMLCADQAVSGLFHLSTGATGIGIPIGLPDGVTAKWLRDTLQISGTPTISGTFEYTIPLTGGCGQVSATGVLEVFSGLDAGSIASTGDTICYAGTPLRIGSVAEAVGGDGNINYSWRSSADDFDTAIPGATDAGYTPPAGLTVSTTYRRYSNDTNCGQEPLQAAGSWRVTVKPLPAITCPGDLQLLTSHDGTGDCQGLASWTHPLETVGACLPLSLTMKIDNNTPIVVSPGMNYSHPFRPGSYTVMYQLIDGGGNTAGCSFTVTMADDELPQVVCAPNTNIRFNGQQTIQLELNELAMVSDNCSLGQTFLIPNSVSIAQLGQSVPVQVVAADAAGNMSFCVTQVSLGGLPAGWSHTSGSVGNCTSNIDYNISNGIWTASATNCRYGSPYQEDMLMFAQHSLCGDGSITVEVTSVQGALPFAGIVMRETNAPGAKKVQMLVNRLSNYIRREIRLTTGGQAFPTQFTSPCERDWIRLVRTGNIFRGYVSDDGITWWYVMQVHVPMQHCIQLGLVLTNVQMNVQGIATFANLTMTGNGQGPVLVQPGIEMALDQPEPLDFRVYPNPVDAQLQVDLSAYVGRPVHMEILGMDGKLLLVKEIAEVIDWVSELQLRSLPVGVYNLRIQSPGIANVSKRILIQR